MVKHLPTVWETQVRSLGWEDPLEEEMATHSSTLAWRIPWTEYWSGLPFPVGWWATVHGVAKIWTRLSNFTFTFTYTQIFFNSKTTVLHSPQLVDSEVAEESQM